jgi:hypothetical protein
MAYYDWDEVQDWTVVARPASGHTVRQHPMRERVLVHVARDRVQTPVHYGDGTVGYDFTPPKKVQDAISRAFLKYDREENPGHYETMESIENWQTGATGTKTHYLDGYAVWDTYKVMEGPGKEGYRFFIIEEDRESDKVYPTRAQASKAARRLSKDHFGGTGPFGDGTYMDNPPADNTMLWVLGIGGAIALTWLWKGGSAQGKTGNLRPSPMGHGQLSPPMILPPKTSGIATAEFGGPWPIHHTRGAGL